MQAPPLRIPCDRWRSGLGAAVDVRALIGPRFRRVRPEKGRACNGRLNELFGHPLVDRWTAVAPRGNQRQQ
jgi:hypothetical protein